MFSIVCKNLQTSVGHMLIKCHSDSSDGQLIAKEVCNHYENSIYVQTHTQDIQANLANLHITTWKGTFQVFLNQESHWLLIDKRHQLVSRDHQLFTKASSVIFFIVILISSRWNV